MSRLHLGIGIATALVTQTLLPAALHAQPPSAEPPLVATAEDEPEPVEARVAWNDDWHRFRMSEAVVTGAMLLPIAGALFLYPNPDDNIHGGFLFDNAVRDALVPDSKSARDRAASLSNLPYFGLLAFPLLVDTALVTAGIHGSGDVALQMLAMDLEAYAITGGISLTFQKLGRVRPAEKGCASDPNYASKCDNPVALNQSFLSGHTSVAFTGAALTCSHHRHLPLYGGGWPDAAICIASLAAASATGVLRIMSDNHYTSDVLLGIGVGLASGWGVPEWLHYGSKERGVEGTSRSSGLLPSWRSENWAAILAPQIGRGSYGLTLIAQH